MQNIFNKYIIYGRKKGKKKIKSLYKNLYKNYLFDLNTNLKNKKIIIDIGSGNGENSLYLSQKFPDSLIIASEIYEDGVVNLCNQLSINKIDNVKIFKQSVMLLIDNMKSNITIDQIWILFPDPWPKKKHHKRRLINEIFLKKIHRILKTGGRIYIATDSISYLVSILYLIYNTKLYKWMNDRPQKWEYSNENIPKTRYYEKAINNERKSRILVFRKI